MENLNKNARLGGLIYTVVLLAYTVLSFLVKLLFNALEIEKDVFYALYPVFSACVFCAAVYFCRVKFSLRPDLRKFRPINFIYIDLIAGGMLFGLGFANDALTRFIESLGGVVARSEIVVDEWWKYIVYSLSLCLLPALYEELFFRGTLLKCFPESNPVPAIFATALCFALYHLSAAQFLYQFVYGVILATLTFSAKSIIPAMITHFINNFLVVTLEFFKISVDFYNVILIACWAFCLTVFTVIMILGIIARVVQKGKADSAREKHGAGNGFFIPFGIVGAVAAILIIVLSVIPA